ELVRDILADLARSLRAWIGGQMLAMVFLGVLTWIGLELLDVPFALAFGVFTGVLVMIPFFGTLVSTLLPALFVLGSGGVWHAFLVVLLGLVVHLIEANFVHPLIMERRVHLPPVLSILSVLVMAELLGPVGLLVAVPVLATVMVITRRIYVHRLLEGKGFRRFVRDTPSEIRLPEGTLRLGAAGVSIPAVLEEAGAAPR
ncbi:MAG TPA: AI-2E family transporter, partial [Longimicrobium sp.]|nr:AI-2E family transporter [Longimicrobium sp.]